MRMRVTNDRHIITYDTSGDGGKTWIRFDRGMEVSGYHHNVRGGFLMLRPGLYSAGVGEARFRNFTFTALDQGPAPKASHPTSRSRCRVPHSLRHRPEERRVGKRCDSKWGIRG